MKFINVLGLQIVISGFAEWWTMDFGQVAQMQLVGWNNAFEVFLSFLITSSQHLNAKYNRSHNKNGQVKLNSKVDLVLRYPSITEGMISRGDCFNKQRQASQDFFA